MHLLILEQDPSDNKRLPKELRKQTCLRESYPLPFTGHPMLNSPIVITGPALGHNPSAFKDSNKSPIPEREMGL
jgi:hypothetical protein